MNLLHRSLWLSVACFSIASSVAWAQNAPALEDLDDPLKHCKVTIIDEVLVPAEEMGVLDELIAKEGMVVEKGQLLGSIDKKDALLAVEIARAEFQAAKRTSENELSIKAAQLAYEVAQAEYDASIEANRKRKGTVTQTEVRRKKLQADRAQMQAELAAEELEIAKLDAYAKKKAFERAQQSLSRREIRSRINGIVEKVNKNAGEWVQPGDPVLRIIRMDQLRIEGDIDGRIHARHDIVGRPVTITIKLTGGGVEKFDGKIEFGSVIVESNEYIVRAQIDNKRVNGEWLITPGLDAEMELGTGLSLQVSRRGE